MMYDVQIKYVNTKEFGCVDVDAFDTSLKPDVDIVIACVTLEDDCSSDLNEHFSELPVTFNMFF